MLINAFFIVDGKDYDFERFWFGGTLLYAIFVFVAPECFCRASRDVRINYTADKHLLPLTLVCALVLPRSRFFLSQTKGNFRLVLIFCSVCVYHVVIKVQYGTTNIQIAECVQFLVAFDKTSNITHSCSFFTGMKLTNEHLVLSKTILQSEWLVFWTLRFNFY